MNILTVDYRNDNAAELLAESFCNTGFAVITHHPIEKKLFDQVYNDWRNFFASEEKNNYLFDKELQDGFFPLHIAEKAKGYHVKDIKEFFHFYPWGRHPQNLSAATLEMNKQLTDLATLLLSWLEKHLPSRISSTLSEPLSRMIENSANTLLRIIHYPPLSGQEDQGAVRAAAHEDINLITLLPAATQPGLQVLDNYGKWHEVTCDYNSIVVNSGDMLDMCTAGYYRSTTHRVINPINSSENQSRLSMPLFLHPRGEVQLSANYNAKEYLHERLAELGLV